MAVSEWHKVRFETAGQTGRGARFWLDDKEIHGVKRVSISVGTEEVNRVTLEFFAQEVEAEAEAEALLGMEPA